MDDKTLKRLQEIEAEILVVVDEFCKKHNVKVEDYLSDEMKAAGFPASDVLRFIFEDGCWVAVRPSGTEPKMKIYLQAKGTSDAEALSRLEELNKMLDNELL